MDRDERRGHLTLRWPGGTLTECDLSFPRMKPRLHTDEDTISLLRRLAVHYPDEVIAGILNRQGRKTASGERFTANQVGSLRRYRNIPRYEPPAEPPAGQVVPIRQAAQILGINTSTVHRWLNDGFIPGGVAPTEVQRLSRRTFSSPKRYSLPSEQPTIRPVTRSSSSASPMRE